MKLIDRIFGCIKKALGMNSRNVIDYTPQDSRNESYNPCPNNVVWYRMGPSDFWMVGVEKTSTIDNQLVIDQIDHLLRIDDRKVCWYDWYEGKDVCCKFKTKGEAMAFAMSLFPRDEIRSIEYYRAAMQYKKIKNDKYSIKLSKFIMKRFLPAQYERLK